MSKVVRIVMVLAEFGAILLFAGFTSGAPSGEDPCDDVPTFGDQLPGDDCEDPTPTPTTEPVTVVPAPDGERLQLHLTNDVEDIPANMWTIVEWMDTETGKWYQTDGWHGTLDAPTTQTWWVGDDMFGDGPFRWKLYETKDGTLLATSAEFYLPSHAGLMVIVDVTLE